MILQSLALVVVAATLVFQQLQLRSIRRQQRYIAVITTYTRDMVLSAVPTSRSAGSASRSEESSK